MRTSSQIGIAPPPQIDSFSGRRVPDPCPLPFGVLGPLALSQTRPSLPSQPMMKPEGWRTEAWRRRMLTSMSKVYTNRPHLSDRSSHTIPINPFLFITNAVLTMTPDRALSVRELLFEAVSPVPTTTS